MTTTLRDAMAAARINRMKARIARAWVQRQREAEPSEHPVCPGCGKRHARGLCGFLPDDDAPPAPDKSHH